MRDTLNAAKVGLLVIVVLAASIAIYRFVDESSSGKDDRRVYAIFEDVQGLVPKSRVLIAGMGPAGFTLAHFLLNDGHTVVGIDGLKIEALAPEISGVGLHGERRHL